MTFDFSNRALGFIALSVAFIAVIVALTGIAFQFGDKTAHQPPFSSTSDARDSQPQTEVVFLNGLREIPDKDQEWFAARSDHRLLAHAVFNCRGIDNVRINQMPREYYHALLLDLSPYGNHVFRTKDEDSDKLVSIEKNVEPLLLTDNEQTVLALSDSIARARIVAADGARNSISWAKLISLWALLVSVASTLVITWQATTFIEHSDAFSITGSASSDRTQLSAKHAGRRRIIAILAVVLSFAATSLAGLKQASDPTRVVTLNTHALAELEELHHEVVLNARCDHKEISRSPRLQDWISKVARLRASVITEYDPQK